MNVIFLNTWHGTLRNELRKYVAQRIPETAVFCFQEALKADREGYEDLLAEGYDLYMSEQFDKLDECLYANVIYVRKDIPVIGTGSLFTDCQMDAEVGLATYVTLDINGQEVTVCNVHGVPRPGHKLDTPARLRQSRALLDAFADRAAVVIGGDFNLLPEAESVRMFTERGYRNLITEYDIKMTRNHYAYDRYPDNIQYFADYAFVSPGVTLKDFRIPADEVSDHQPLELDLETGEVQVAREAADTAFADR